MGFKERLKEKRLEAGLTQAELAEKVSVTARTIQNYEMGSRKPGNMKVVGDIATVLGTTPEYLLTCLLYTSPLALSIRTWSRQSTVLRAKRETDFVMI